MTIDEAISKSYLLATGKTTTLAQSDAKYLRLFNILDLKQKDWQNQPGVDWMSLWSLVTLNPTVTATDTFALPSTIRKISQRENDSVIITSADGKNTWYYDVITPDKLLEYKDQPACAKVGSNLVFSKAFAATDPQIGGTIKVPSFGYVNDISNLATTGTQQVQVDDPNWLCYAAAAEFDRTDLVRQNQYPNLVALANDRLEVMMEHNEAQILEVDVDLDVSDYSPDNAIGAWQ